MKRSKGEFLQLAHTYKPKHDITGWFLSEKLDGMRCFWDGGATRGVKVVDVPFANIEKQSRFVNEQRATGLWSRYGHPIFAPDYWLDRLPNMLLDGEIYMGRGQFQKTMSVARTLPENRIDSLWEGMRYMVFDTPPLSEMFSVREIRDVNFKKVIVPDMGVMVMSKVKPVTPRDFEGQLTFLNLTLVGCTTLALHKQTRLSFRYAESIMEMQMALTEVLRGGGEGLILRAPNDRWSPYRSHKMLKIKNEQDSEAKVVGYKTANEGKIHGKIGALIVDYNGITFDLSGFTDEEREFADAESKSWAIANPDKTCPTFCKSKHFPIGSVVTFKFFELSDTGVPKNARYYRKHLI